MIRRALLSTVAVATILIAVGCSSSAEEGTDGSENNVEAAPGGPCGATPCPAKTDFDQAKQCDALFGAHAEIRQDDLDEGVVRWKCGDVDGVIQPGLGQEYCEYHAVAIDSGGKTATVIDSAVSAGKLGSQKVECLYTSVFGDVKGLKDEGNRAGAKGVRLLVKDDKSTAFDNENATAVAAALGVATLGTLEDVDVITKGGTVHETNRAASGMYGGFNTRGAATALLQDCANTSGNLEGGRTGDRQKHAVRVAACYLAFKNANANGNTDLAQKLQTACTSTNKTALADDATWNKVQALDASVKEADGKDQAAFDAERDIAGCVRTPDGGGVPWRNSDPTICTRSMRAGIECGDDFNALPDKPGLIDGFEMTGWTGRSLAGTKCHYVQKDGKDYHHLVVCEPAASDVKAAITAKKPLQAMCNQLFGNVVAMQAPIGAVTKINPKADSAHCLAYHKGAAKIQAAISGASSAGAQ